MVSNRLANRFTVTVAGIQIQFMPNPQLREECFWVMKNAALRRAGTDKAIRDRCAVSVRRACAPSAGADVFCRSSALRSEIAVLVLVAVLTSMAHARNCVWHEECFRMPGTASCRETRFEAFLGPNLRGARTLVQRRPQDFRSCGGHRPGDSAATFPAQGSTPRPNLFITLSEIIASPGFGWINEYAARQ